MTTRTPPSTPQPDLNNLMSLLEVKVIGLSECLVSPGFKLVLDGNTAPGLHYILSGTGKLHVRGRPSVELKPHTLIIVPPKCPFELEVPPSADSKAPTTSVQGRTQNEVIDSIHRFTAGDEEPKTIMICGYFKALYGSSIDLFGSLAAPIVEYFNPSDHLDHRLQTAIDELMAQEIGAGAMTAALLKQVIVALLRRSLKSNTLWAERFSMLSDPKIARAFADMVAQPGASHTILTLADAANLSRSTFMARFTSVIGRTPMQILRDLRMKQAASQLDMGSYTVDQVARNSGYTSRASFVRAFKETYGTEPKEYRDSKHL